MLHALAVKAQSSREDVVLRWHANETLSMSMRKGVLLANQRSRNSGFSARVFHQGAFGFAAVPDDCAGAVDKVLALAAENAELPPRAGAHELASAAPGKGAFDYRLAGRTKMTAAERVEIFRALDAAIAAKYPDLVNRDLGLTAFCSEKALATSGGAETFSATPRVIFGVNLALQANDGIVELHDSLGGLGEIEDYFSDLPAILARIDALYEDLRQKAAGAFCEAGAHEVVLDSNVAGILAHEAIGHTCEADLVLAGSVAGNCLGQQVASEKITLGDYGGRGPDGRSSFAIHVDDEGAPCEDVALIENGVLKNFLHSRDTAQRLGAAPTGNARAFAFTDEPLIRMRSTAILPGSDRLEDMIGGIENGYYFRRATNGQADLTGEFMFGIDCGREIRNGKLGRAIRDTTISGVAFDMLKTVTHVGDTLSWSPSGWCGKKQPITVGMGGPAIRCTINVGGRQ
jgi:TldD protein